MLHRRDLLLRAAALAVAGPLAPCLRAAAPREFTLDAAPTVLQLADDGGPPLPVWGYNGTSPGPVLRLVVVGPAMRVDLILDCIGQPGSMHAVSDHAHPRRPFQLTTLAYAGEALRDAKPAPVPVLPRPALPEPDLRHAEQHELLLDGGAMGGLHEAILDGQRLGIRELARRGKVWALNGVAASGHHVAPWLHARLGSTHVIRVHNRTAFPHPMHLHGHPVQVLARNDVQVPFSEWRDTVLVWPREQLRVAFVADNPGSWMIHCHIPEHQEAGMMGVVQVG
jgi:FtsP/CotA-like multicopper oxidase with cupredoxin domain